MLYKSALTYSIYFDINLDSVSVNLQLQINYLNFYNVLICWRNEWLVKIAFVAFNWWIWDIALRLCAGIH
jgi:hypothetical protein